MTTRYGVSGATCGPREVIYEQQGCIVCLPIKLGEKQIFDVDFSAETRCNPTKVGCYFDYNDIVDIITVTATKEVSLGTGLMSVSVTGVIPPKNGVVQLIVDATNIDLLSDESWEISVTVELEDGRYLKQCFKIKTTSCGESGSASICFPEDAPTCGAIISTSATCGNGIFDVVGDVPINAGCMQASSTVDTFYTLNGSIPTAIGSSPIPLAAGMPIVITNQSEINGFRMESAEHGCEDDLCVTVTFREYS